VETDVCGDRYSGLTETHWRKKTMWGTDEGYLWCKRLDSWLWRLDGSRAAERARSDSNRQTLVCLAQNVTWRYTYIHNGSWRRLILGSRCTSLSQSPSPEIGRLTAESASSIKDTLGCSMSCVVCSWPWTKTLSHCSSVSCVLCSWPWTKTLSHCSSVSCVVCSWPWMTTPSHCSSISCVVCSWPWTKTPSHCSSVSCVVCSWPWMKTFSHCSSMSCVVCSCPWTKTLLHCS